MCKQRSTRTEIRANLSFFGYKKDKPKKTKRNRLLSVSMSVQFWRFQKKKQPILSISVLILVYES